MNKAQPSAHMRKRCARKLHQVTTIAPCFFKRQNTITLRQHTSCFARSRLRFHSFFSKRSALFRSCGDTFASSLAVAAAAALPLPPLAAVGAGFFLPMRREAGRAVRVCCAASRWLARPLRAAERCKAPLAPLRAARAAPHRRSTPRPALPHLRVRRKEKKERRAASARATPPRGTREKERKTRKNLRARG